MTAILVFTTIAVHQYVLLPNFINIEKDKAAKDLNRVVDLISNEIEHLDTITNDLSSWNETYEYARDYNVEYEISNLTIANLLNNRLNLLLLINNSGAIIWGIAVNETYESAISIKPFEKLLYDKDFPLLFNNPENIPVADWVKSGVINTDHGLMLFVSRPILDSNEKGPPRGTFISGRLLGTSMLEKIAHLTGVKFDITNLNAKENNSSIGEWSDLKNSGNIHFEVLDEKIEAHINFLGHTNKPSIEVKIQDDRNFISQGMESLKNSLLFILGGVAIALGMMMIMLQNSVVKPLQKITSHIIKRKDGHKIDIDPKNWENSSLEVFTLAKEFHDLLSQIDEKTKKISDGNISLKNETKKLRAAEKELMVLDKLKSEFISTAAHELRTPIASIIGYTELLTNKDISQTFSDAQKDDFHNEVLENSSRLVKIIDDVLDVSRIEAGLSIPLTLNKTSIEKLLAKSVERFEIKAKQTIICKFSKDLPKDISLDDHRFSQVIDNLISNAIKYSPDNSEIFVIAEKRQDTCLISVIDNGKGMTREQVSKVFDKFYRADSTNTAISGLGLGMSIARQIVTDHGGDIFVESEIGKGTKVFITLPLKSEDN